MLSQLYICGKLAKVCEPDDNVVDVTQLLNMSTEERHIRALPPSMRRFMAECVLAGYRFEYHTEGEVRDIWYVWDNTGAPIAARGFTGLMFALDRIGFNEWLREAGKRQLIEEGYSV